MIHHEGRRWQLFLSILFLVALPSHEFQIRSSTPCPRVHASWGQKKDIAPLQTAAPEATNDSPTLAAPSKQHNTPQIGRKHRMSRVKAAVARAQSRFRSKKSSSVWLFPTYANMERKGFWRIRFKGWIFRPRSPHLKSPKVVNGLARFLGIRSGTEEHECFTNRTSKFIVKNLRGRGVTLQCCGDSDDQCGVQLISSTLSDKYGHFDKVEFKPFSDLPEDVSLESMGEEGAPKELVVCTVPQSAMESPTYGFVYFVPPRGYSVISDIDDTVKHTEVCHRHAMLSNTFLREFQLVEGMQDLYQSWADQGAAFHYVSSSPWQLQPDIQNLFEQAGVPMGSFHLRDFDVRSSKLLAFLRPSTRTKPKKIHAIMDNFPHRRFILVGDSGEKDPEIYAHICRAKPNQVERVYIRKVEGDARPEGDLEEVFLGVPDHVWTIFDDAKSLSHDASHSLLGPRPAQPKAGDAGDEEKYQPAAVAP